MNILRKEFTANVELDLDRISNGRIDYVTIIRKVYNSFNDIVEKQLIEKPKQNMKYLGKKSGANIYIATGKYGPYLHILKGKDKKNINIQKYLEIKKKDINTINFKEIIEFLKYPKKINNKILIYIGQNGYYMKYNGRNYKINQSGNYSEEYCNGLIK